MNDNDDCGFQGSIDPRLVNGTYVPEPEPTHQGCREGKDYDSLSYKWAVFDRKEVEEWAKFEGHVIYNDDGTPKGELGGWLTGWHRSWSGAGRGFCNDAYARVSRTRILVKQGCGLDI